MAGPVYKRVLVKISGEAIAGGGGEVLSFGVIEGISGVIRRCLDEGVQIGLVIGGGNIWRGAKDGGGRMDRSRADHMGMLATAINCLAIADVLERNGIEVRVQTAVEMRPFAEPFARLRAISHLDKGRVVVFGCGTGNPYFTTDTAALLRGAEIGANIVLLAKNVDGVYDDDPKTNPGARRYDELSPGDFLRDDLKAMDAAAASFIRDNRIPVLLFALSDPENIYRAVMGEKIGTMVR
ncbi:MAG: UMP kinase [Oscillospiraceae bacterium]|jgi:uridylate kinase|nr:UMP kinase [Oscillospiraceae bacterium]